MVDAAEGVLGIEWIDGKSVRKLLPGGAEDEEALEEASNGVEDADIDPLEKFGVSVGKFMFDLPRSLHHHFFRSVNEPRWH